MAAFQIYEDDEDEWLWKWRLVATDGSYLCTSLHGFETPEEAHEDIKKVKRAARMRTKVEKIYLNNENTVNN